MRCARFHSTMRRGRRALRSTRAESRINPWEWPYHAIASPISNRPGYIGRLPGVLPLRQRAAFEIGGATVVSEIGSRLSRSTTARSTAQPLVAAQVSTATTRHGPDHSSTEGTQDGISARGTAHHSARFSRSHPAGNRRWSLRHRRKIGSRAGALADRNGPRLNRNRRRSGYPPRRVSCYNTSSGTLVRATPRSRFVVSSRRSGVAISGRQVP